MQMNEITHTVNGKETAISLTAEEMRQIYQHMKQEYLTEDFMTELENQQCNCEEVLFTPEHLEKYPEITQWLISCFEQIEDSNISHNDLIALSLNHLNHAAREISFFSLLAQTVPAVCLGETKDISKCERTCSRYYRCDNVAEANDRSKHWELLATLLSMHHTGKCCCKTEGNQKMFCSAALYLNGFYSISDFYDAELGKEAA